MSDLRLAMMEERIPIWVEEFLTRIYKNKEIPKWVFEVLDYLKINTNLKNN